MTCTRPQCNAKTDAQVDADQARCRRKADDEQRRFTWPVGLDTHEDISTMTAIRSYVAATDFSPGSNAALERAVSLAATHGASLRLLHGFAVAAVP